MTSEDTIEHRTLGTGGLSVSAIGLGCMSMSGIYGQSDDQNGIDVIRHAIDRGIDFLDTSDMYGWGHNEEIVGRAIKGRRQQAKLATKFGQVKGQGGANDITGRPEYVALACTASLKRLGAETIDLYYQHRVDPAVPIEDTVGAMALLVKAGKVRYLGLSEAHPDTIRRAHKVHPISAVQTEYSLLYRKEAEETLATTRQLGIAFVAYSPLGRGFLAGSVRTPADIQGDRRGQHPRFSAGNFEHNRGLVSRVEGIAREKGCTPAQLTLAWLLAQGPEIVPIPGTKRRERVDENIKALKVRLTSADIDRIAAAVPSGAVAGARYPDATMKAVYL